MKINKLGYCGLFCGACEMFLSTNNNRLSMLSKKEDIPETLLMCEGCKSKITSILKTFENDYCLHHKGLIRSQESIMDIDIENYII